MKETWEETYDMFYNDNEAGGSSRWLVSPDTVKVFIRGIIQQAKKEQREEDAKIAEENLGDCPLGHKLRTDCLDVDCHHALFKAAGGDIATAIMG